MESETDQEDPCQSISIMEVGSIVANDQNLLVTMVKSDATKGCFSTGPLRYAVDKAWDPGTRILGESVQDPAIAQKFDSVAEDSFLKKSFGGRIKSIVKALARAVLVKEDFPSTCPFSELAHVIKKDLLDPATRLESLPLFLGVGSVGECATVWPRTALCFQLLSGTSILLSATHQALPPFRSFSFPSTPTMTASASDLEPKTSNPKPPNDGCVEGLSF